MKRIVLIAAALCTGAPALAGSLSEPEVAAPPVAPVVVAPVYDWSGFYGGAQLGYGNVDTDAAGVDGDGLIGGLTAGYDYDFGNYVLGAGIDYDLADIDLGAGASLDSVLRLKARAGIEAGPSLLYLTGGWAQADVDTLGEDDGYFVGAGVEYPLGGSLFVGGEVLYHEFDDFEGSGVDVDATTVQARLTFRF